MGATTRLMNTSYQFDPQQLQLLGAYKGRQPKTVRLALTQPSYNDLTSPIGPNAQIPLERRFSLFLIHDNDIYLLPFH